MRHYILSITFLLFLLPLTVNTAFSQSKKKKKKKTTTVYVFEGVHVIPMTRNVVVEEQTVVVKNGKIKAMGPLGFVKIPEGAIKIRSKGKYLMPGLAEMHAHIPVPKEGDQELLEQTLFLYLSNGVTTIRGMLGDPFHLELKEMIKDGDILSPRVYTSSPSLNGNTVTTKEEARAKVMEYKKAGYDFLKIHPGIQLDVFKELAKTAIEQEIPFSGHVPADVGIITALASGYASIDHMDGYVAGLVPEAITIDREKGGFFGYNFTSLTDLERIEIFAQMTKVANTWVVPTQTLFTRWFSPDDPAEMANEPEMKYMSSATLFQWRQSKQRMISDEKYNLSDYLEFINIREKLILGLHEGGVNLLLGSDAPQVFNVPGFSIQHELKAMSKAGLSNFVVLESGTANPARFFKREGKFGTIVKGASADLILLEDNPLDSLDHVRNSLGVMVRGEWVSRKEIDRKLAKIAEKIAAEPEPTEEEEEKN